MCSSVTSSVCLQMAAHPSSLTAGNCSCAGSCMSPIFVPTLFLRVPQIHPMEFKSGQFASSLITVCTCLASKGSIPWSHMAVCEFYADHNSSVFVMSQQISSPFWEHSHNWDQHISMCTTPATAAASSRLVSLPLVSCQRIWTNPFYSQTEIVLCECAIRQHSTIHL
jgi:hypothetical protein